MNLVDVRMSNRFPGGWGTEQQSSMAADNGDLTALVFNEEVPESTYIPEEKDTEYDSTVEVLPENRSYVSGTADKEQQQHFITAVFVVSFDTRKGSGGWSFVFVVNNVESINYHNFNN